MSAYARLIQTIKKYESDTFSAANAEMTNDEAEKAADVLIDRLIKNDIDGVLIASALSVVRGHQ